MIHELKPGDFYKVTGIFRGHKQYIPVMAVIEGNFPGRIFVDNRDRPETALVWAISRWSYIDGNPDNLQFLHSIANLLNRTVIPVLRKVNRNWFEIYSPNSTQWMKALESCLRDFDSGKHFETTFTWDKRKYSEIRSDYSFPKGLSITQAEIPIMPSNIIYDSLIGNDFRSSTAIGMRVMDKNRVVAHCRSNGFSVGDEFMIDVETFNKKDRGKGYATAAGIALMDYCLDKGLKPLWEATEDNIASRKLAKKLGFIEDESYPVYGIEF